MKIIVSNPAEQNELRRFVARLEFIWGDGVRITTHRQPLTAADMRALANALNLAANGFERGDAEETVRDRIEGTLNAMLIEQIDEHLRLVSVGGEEFMLMSRYMPSQFGEYVWNATRLGTGIGTGGFAASSVEGFAAAEKEAVRMLAGASRAGYFMAVMDMLDSAQGEINADDPQFRSEQLGRIEEPPIDPESDTLPPEKRMQMNGYFEDLNQRVHAATHQRAAELESAAVAIGGDLMSEILRHYKPSLAPSTTSATELNAIPDGFYVVAYNPLSADGSYDRRDRVLFIKHGGQLDLVLADVIGGLRVAWERRPFSLWRRVWEGLTPRRDLFIGRLDDGLYTELITRYDKEVQ